MEVARNAKLSATGAYWLNFSSLEPIKKQLKEAEAIFWSVTPIVPHQIPIGLWRVHDATYASLVGKA